MTAYGLHLSMGTWLFIPALLVYGSILSTSGYALSHETAHGTAFRTRWLNELCFWLSSFIYFEEPYHRRYAHARHHTYTYHKQYDAQMPQGTPFTFREWWRDIIGLNLFIFQGAAFLKCASGRYSDIIREFTPDSELPKLKWSARIYLLGYAAVGVAIALGAEFLRSMFGARRDHLVPRVDDFRHKHDAQRLVNGFDKVSLVKSKRCI